MSEPELNLRSTSSRRLPMAMKMDEQEDHDHDPFGERYVGYDGAAFDAEDESGGKDHDIEDGDGFQSQGIGQVDHEIDSQYEKEFVSYKPGEGEAGEDKDGTDDQSRGRSDGAGGQGPFAFHGVFPVVFAVAVVVDDIDATGYKGKGDCAEKHVEQLVDIKDLTTEKQGNEQEQIFCPIFWTQEF